MAKVTFSIEPVVCITILGEKKSKKNDFREDDGLIGRFMRFAIDNKIFTVKHRGYSGPGMYLHFYTAEDATKIKAWLLKQGAKEKKE